MEYFLINKTPDYERGFTEHVSYSGKSLSLETSDCEKPGIFISRIFDTLEPQTRWHRFTSRLELPPNTAAEIRFYGAEEEAHRELAQRILNNHEDSGEERLRKMDPFLKLRLTNRGEALLNQVTARYLWLSVILWGNGAESPEIEGMQLYFLWESLVSWLPEVYESPSGGFLERFLAVFQTIYQEADRQIRQFPSLLDLEAADDETLLWLADWLSMDNLHSWPADRLKRYLSEGAAVFGRRGTKRGIKHMVYLYTGYHPYIIEPKDRPGEFLLLIEQAAVPSYQEYQALFRVVNEIKPAHMEARLVVLKPGVSLNRGSYLGINSVVRNYPPPVLGQMAQADYTLLLPANDSDHTTLGD